MEEAQEIIEYVDEHEYRIEERIYGDNTRKYVPQFRTKPKLINLPKEVTIVGGWIDCLDDETSFYTTKEQAQARVNWFKECRFDEFKARLIKTNYYPA